MSVHGDTDWGDYDNDGDLDLIVSGYVGYVNGTNTFSTKLYQNLGNSVFEDTQFNFTIAPDGYVILSSQDPSVCEEDFNFISYVNDSCFTHFGVNLFYGSMFYVVKGIKFDRSVNHNSVKDLLNSVPVSKWKQVKTFIESFNHGVVSN